MAIGILEVLLVNAKALQDSDFIGNMDPYVVVQYKSQERKSSVARDNAVNNARQIMQIHKIPGEGGSPVWNEKLSFKVEYPGGSDDYKLTLIIMDKDTFSSDDFVGKAIIYIKDLLALGVENGTAEFHPRKYSVVNNEQSYRGEIQVGVTFTLKEEEDGGEEYGGWKQSCH